jgi:hypothetical protein
MARPTADVIRIVLAEMSGLTGEFVRAALGKQRDMTIIREVRTSDELVMTGPGAEVDVVVTSLAGAQLPAAYQRLIFRIPSVPVVAISPDRRHLEVYGRTVVPDVALDQLVDLIRSLARTPGAGGDVPRGPKGDVVGS